MSNPSEISNIAEDNDQSQEDDVKERSLDQREAFPGEPLCFICGRYGEYICDETDDDICSRECKRTLLTQVANKQASSSRPATVRLPARDECFYVREENTIKPQILNNDHNELLRQKLEISVKGGDNVPSPILSFGSCDLPQKLLQNLEFAGYEMPTPVQMQAIPAALTGQSLLVSAETGSGKTGSFLVPIVSHCTKLETNPEKTRAIVLAPTRELCIQIEEQAKQLGRGLPFKTALVIGGDPMAGQVHRLEQGVSMIVGTPGRLIDLLTKHNFELDGISILVLDEVDCMIERGFHDQVMQIFQALSRPQVLMYSATVSKEVEKVASSMAKDVTFISVGKPNKPNRSVKQTVIWVESKKKKQKLFDILSSKQHFKPPALVFVGSRLGADLLCEAITVTTGIRALSIHAEKTMKERRDVLRLFLLGEVSVLVATGILGRGVDLLSVKQVIVFDMPTSIKEYVHMIGRATRMREDGVAMVFVNDEDKKHFPELIETLESSGAAIPRELAVANSQYMASFLSGGRPRKKMRRG